MHWVGPRGMGLCWRGRRCTVSVRVIPLFRSSPQEDEAYVLVSASASVLHRVTCGSLKPMHRRNSSFASGHYMRSLASWVCTEASSMQSKERPWNIGRSDKRIGMERIVRLGFSIPSTFPKRMFVNWQLGWFLRLRLVRIADRPHFGSVEGLIFSGWVLL